MVMNPMLVFSFLSALAAAVWSVWTWREDQERQRSLKRDQESALFVNSYIVALEELQSRLYGILEKDDLAFYKKEYPEKYEFGSPFAIEVLYRFSKYCGWTYRTFRYGPYTNDPVVIELVRKIGETLESRSRFPGEAFRFTYEERVALGDVVVRRTGDVMGAIPVFESITVFQFFEEMSDKLSKHAQIFQSRCVRRTLAAIDQADQAEALEGVERLAVLQNHLIDLLTYLEDKEGFSVSPARRRRAPLRGTAAEALPTPATNATVVHQIPGRLRIRVPRLRTDDTYEPRLHSLLDAVDNVRSIKINASAASVLISYNPQIPGMEFANRLIKAIETGSATL
jgi:hypothetical protein